MIDVCDIQTLRPLLEGCGFRFSKAKGQNFLIASWVPRAIADGCGADAGTVVLEIGPGVGALTQQLCLRAGKVCAVELDRRLEPILARSLEDFDNVELIWADALKLDLAELVRRRFQGLRPVACANLPYYITTPILTALLEAGCFQSVTVMVQKEVAQRMAAAPGTAEYGALSVLCRYYARPELLFDVPPHCFQPQPGVTSAVIRLEMYEACPWDVPDPALFFRVVRGGFAQRRKKLSNGLAAAFPELGRTGAAAVLEQAGFGENVRAETLDIPDFARIAREIGRKEDTP